MDDKLYEEAAKATGVTEKTQLIHMGLKALIQEAAYKRLAKLHGAIPQAKAPPRRRIK